MSHLSELSHLSYSSINTWQLCPRSWAYRYVERIQAKRSAALVFGSAFHTTLESYIRARCDGLTEEAVSIWSRVWQAEMKTAVDIDWDTDTPEQLSNDGVRMFGHKDTQMLLHNLQPLIEAGEPVIERKVELRVPGVPLPIIGYIDMVQSDHVPCDFKTAARAWTLDKLDGELQPLFYLAALSQGNYKPCTSYRFRHYVFVKTKTPQVQTLESLHSAAELLWLLDLIRSVWVAIQAGAFPCNTSSWKCSAKWCEYWSLCRGRVLKPVV
jgi:hypothetical protein